MGTWGTGNFDSDTALDYILYFDKTHIQPIVREVEAAIHAGVEPEEEGAYVMCQVEMLCWFAEKFNARLPASDVVELWKQKYLTTWDGHMNQPRLFEPSGPNENDLERRKVIVETWERLASLSRWQNEQ